jgi:hypothetical protein
LRQLAIVASVVLPPDDDGEEARIVLALHHSYTALESLLERIHRDLLGLPTGGPDWHRRLLDSAADDLPGLRPRLIPAALLPHAHALRGFRDVVRHAYAGEYDAARLQDLQGHAAQLATLLPPAIDAIEAWLLSMGPTQGG